MCLFLICLFIGSCYSQFDVSVTVLEPFCLNYYYDDDLHTIPQLQLEFDVVYGGRRSNSYYFQTDFDDSNTTSHFKFDKNMNIISSIIPRCLVLDSPIPLPAVSPDDNLDIRIDINPVYKWGLSDDDTHDKCSSDERLHNHTVIPKSMLYSETNHIVTSQFTIDLSQTPCLNSTEKWFHNIKAQITILVDFDCHGPCKDLFRTTTTTGPDDCNKLITPLVTAVVVSGLTFAFIIGYCIHLRHKANTNSQKQEKMEIEQPMYHHDRANENNTEYRVTEEEM